MQIRYETGSDAKMQRGVEAKSVTENSSDEYESIVGWICQSDNKNFAECSVAVTVGWAYQPNNKA